MGEAFRNKSDERGVVEDFDQMAEKLAELAKENGRLEVVTSIFSPRGVPRTNKEGQKPACKFKYFHGSNRPKEADPYCDPPRPLTPLRSALTFNFCFTSAQFHLVLPRLRSVPSAPKQQFCTRRPSLRAKTIR